MAAIAVSVCQRGGSNYSRGGMVTLAVSVCYRESVGNYSRVGMATLAASVC